MSKHTKSKKTRPRPSDLFLFFFGLDLCVTDCTESINSLAGSEKAARHFCVLVLRAAVGMYCLHDSSCCWPIFFVCVCCLETTTKKARRQIKKKNSLGKAGGLLIGWLVGWSLSYCDNPSKTKSTQSNALLLRSPV